MIRTFRSFKFFHQQTSFFRTSFNIIWKNDFLHKSWESGKDWFWPFEPIWKLKTTFCKYWTSIQYWEHEGKTKITRRKNHSYTWSFYWVTTWILLFSGSNETWEFLGIFPCEGGGRGRSSAKSIVCIGVSCLPPLNWSTIQGRLFRQFSLLFWFFGNPTPPLNFRLKVGFLSELPKY